MRVCDTVLEKEKEYLLENAGYARYDRRKRVRRRMMADCIFCKIANGEIPSATIYEDDDFKVILDVGPATKGHALILPKMHYEDITKMPEELLAKAMILAKRIICSMKEALPCDGYNLVQNNGTAAGQTVFHFHIHLIPRYQDDNAGIHWKTGVLSEEIKHEILEKANDLF